MLQNQNTKNVLVTGGTGYVGSHVCKYLFEQKYNVFVLDRNVEARPFANRYGTYYNLDYNNENDLEQIDNIIIANQRNQHIKEIKNQIFKLNIKKQNI